MTKVFKETRETLSAEKEIIRFIKANPLPLVIRIGKRLFGILHKNISKELQKVYQTEIPYYYDTGSGKVRYTLKAE